MRLHCIYFGVLVLFMSVFGPAATQAGMVSFTADVMDGPGYNRPEVGNPPTFLSAGAVNSFFDAQPFSVDVTGTYRMEVVTHLSGNSDSFLILYDSSFDPSNPLANALEANDDGGSGLLSRIDHMLTAGANYVLVTTTFNNNALGSFSNEIEGQGDIRLGSVSAVPEPSTFALLGIGGIVLVGYGWRRKWQQAA